MNDIAKAVSDLAAIDIDNLPDLATIADDVNQSKQLVALRRNGEILAVIEPFDLESMRDVEPSRLIVEREALRRSAGGWRGLVDTEEFRESNRESRRHSSRPPVSL